MKKGVKGLAALTALSMLCAAAPSVSYAAEERGVKVKEEIDSTGVIGADGINLGGGYEDIADDVIQNVILTKEKPYQVFRFIPDETREYTFFSEGRYDTYGMIMQEDGSLLSYNDDRDDEEDYNFATKALLTRGTVYYCVAQMFSTGMEGSFVSCISSVRNSLQLMEDDIAEFEILEPAKPVYYTFEMNDVSAYNAPVEGLKYRITCKDGFVYEGTVDGTDGFIYGLRLNAAYKNVTEDEYGNLYVDTARENAVIYSFADCEPIEVPITFNEPSPVKSIVVNTSPWSSVNQYNVEEAIDEREGLSLTINYTDGTSRNLVVDEDNTNSTQIDDGFSYRLRYSWRDYDYDSEMVLFGDNAIIISYMGASVAVPVTVEEDLTAGISIEKDPENIFGNGLDLYGLGLRILYKDGTSKVVNVTGHGSSFSIDGKSVTASFIYDDDDFVEGVRIRYMNQSIVYNPVKSIAILKNPDRSSYLPFENRPDLYGLQLRITYKSGVIQDLTAINHSSSVYLDSDVDIAAYANFELVNGRRSIKIYFMDQAVECYADFAATYAQLMANASSISSGQTVSVALDSANLYRIFRFVPSETADYEIISNGDNEIDSYVHLIDQNGNELATNDDADDSTHFKLNYRLESGKTYYYLVRMYSVGNTGTFTVTLNGGVKATGLVMGKTQTRIRAGASEKLTVILSPASAGSRFVTWSSSNPAVASVSADGTVTAVSSGTAVITAQADGYSAVCQVIVPFGIAYELNGGQNHVSNPSEYYNETINLQNPARKKYAFAGWYTDRDFKNRITQITAGTNQNYILYAKWTKVSAPGKTKLNSVRNAKSKKITVKYKKVKKASGYEIAYSQNKKFKKKKIKTVTSKKNSVTIGKLKKGKTYYVRVRAYKLDSTGNKVCGKWTSAKQVKIEK